MNEQRREMHDFREETITLNPQAESPINVGMQRCWTPERPDSGSKNKFELFFVEPNSVYSITGLTIADLKRLREFIKGYVDSNKEQP